MHQYQILQITTTIALASNNNFKKIAKNDEVVEHLCFGFSFGSKPS
jgi:hypothetical protein